MYRNNFVLSIQDSQGNTLRENREGQVFLPFDSEYKLYLKNNNLYRRALVKVKIDGSDVTGSGIILPRNYGFDLERFVVDGNLTTGRKFKFVSLNSPAVADPTNSNNGTIEVEFRLEKSAIVNIPQYIPYQPIYYTYPFPTNLKPYVPPGWSTIEYGNVSGGIYKSSGTSFCCNNNITTTSFNSVADLQKGATVEGSASNQSFVTSSIGELEEVSTILRLQILAPKSLTEPITVTDTKNVFCPGCRARVKWNDSYCYKCGEKLTHKERVIE